ncbi:ORF6N domain-containing protein [Gemmatimonadota bacterium]
MQNPVIPAGAIEQRILIRGIRIIIDADLAEFYGVQTRRINEQVKRNKDRFPADFLFQLTSAETSELVAKCDLFRNLKHSTVLPYAFTEHGALMAASVLKSERAVEVSVFVVRAFVKLRQMILEHDQLSQKLTELELRFASHDVKISELSQAIRELMDPVPVPERRRIGFRSESSELSAE